MTIRNIRTEIKEFKNCITWFKLDLAYATSVQVEEYKLKHQRTAISDLLNMQVGLKALVTVRPSKRFF